MSNDKLQVGRELEQSLKCKTSELVLESKREEMRPHRLYQASVSYNPNEQKYICRLPAFDVEDDEEDIYAYGDTPAQACDNFDSLWVHGPSK